MRKESGVLETEDVFSKGRRRPWIAALLGLFLGPIGQVYAGAAKRGMVLYLLILLVAPVAFFVAIQIPSTRIACYSLFAVAVAVNLFFPIDAYRVARRANQTNQPRRGYQRWWVYVVAILVVFAVDEAQIRIIRLYVAEGFSILTNPMGDTIIRHERFLVDKAFGPAEPDYEDVVCFVHSDEFEDNSSVLRVVGLPGDTIEVRNEKVYRNGEALDEPYANHFGDKPPTPELLNSDLVVVPEGHMYVLGDNRRFAYDSRMRGCVSLDSIFGYPRFVYWSMKPEQKDSGFLGRIRWSRIGQAIQN